jgi:uncharacterized protein
LFAPVLPPANLDLWDIGHALLGFAMGTIQLKRWFVYPLKIAWEIYQVLTHYSHLTLAQTWVNTIFDFAVFASVYEGVLFIARRLDRTRWGLSLTRDSKGVASFLAMTFGGAFVMAWDLERSTAPALLQLTTVVVPIALCPGIAAFLTRWLKTGEGLWDKRNGPPLKNQWPYLIVAVAVPLLIAVAAETSGRLAPALLPGWLQVSNISGGLAGISAAASLFVRLAGLTAVLVPVMLVQEYGWRGYLQRRIFKGRPEPAAIAAGLIWGIWLSLVTFRAYRLGGLELLKLLLPVSLGTTSLSVILGWLESKTGGIRVPAVFHAAVSAAGGSLIFAPVYFSAGVISVSSVGMWFLIPLLLLAVPILVGGRKGAAGA